MNEQIKISVPDGYVARHNPDGTIDIVPGTELRGPQAHVSPGVTRWAYETWASAQAAWLPMTGYEVRRAGTRPTEGPTTRAVRMAMSTTVTLYGDTEEEIQYGLDAIRDAVQSINDHEGR